MHACSHSHCVCLHIQQAFSICFVFQCIRVACIFAYMCVHVYRSGYNMCTCIYICMHICMYVHTCSIVSLYNTCARVYVCCRLCLHYTLTSPYRNEYLCFQKITKLEYSVPDGFPDNAKDVVTKLLVSYYRHNVMHSTPPCPCLALCNLQYMPVCNTMYIVGKF